MSQEIFEEELWNDFHTSTGVQQQEKNISEIVCKGCGSDKNKFVITNGDIVCVGCGLVQESSIISDEAEWNSYVEDGVVNGSGIRCGNVLDSTNPYDTGNTFVPRFHWSWHLDENGVKRYTNLSRIAIRTSYSSKQRAFDEGKYSFEQIQERLTISPVVFNTAKLFWGIILKSDILKRGGNRRGMKACCIFYACLSEKQQRNREDIAQAFDIKGTQDFTKGEKIFREIFEKDPKYSWILYRDSETESMYQRYVNQFNLPFRFVKTMNLIKTHVDEHFLGIASKSEVAGVLFYTCKEVFALKHPNKSEIAKTIGICNPTLNKVIEIIRHFYTLHPELRQLL